MDALLNCTPLSVDSRLHYSLAKNTPAMQIISDETGKLRLGTLIRLPDGGDVQICGEGFNDRTAKVLFGGSTYYVFVDDLRASLNGLAAATGR